jgi:guanine nucleotide-binding protein G(q) subunit alpha
MAKTILSKCFSENEVLREQKSIITQNEKQSQFSTSRFTQFSNSSSSNGSNCSSPSKDYLSTDSCFTTNTLCCFGETDEDRTNRIIDIELKKQKLLASKATKVLLLGTAESGKSTFIKQMQIIHGGGYSEIEKRQHVKIILQNIIIAMQYLVEAMNTLQIPYKDTSSHNNARIIQEINLNEVTIPEKSFMGAIKSLWNDQGIRMCYDEQHEYQHEYISDSITYFLSHIDRLNQPEYLPTEQDILRCRVPTSGIVEYSFNIQKQSFRMMDVGGQRTERKKWIHCFEDVTSVIFLAALSDYNEGQHVLKEDPENGRNRLDISISLFKLIRRNPWFHNSSMILFLNKTDLLKEKIKTIHLEDSFPQYQGEKYDDKSARNFILKQFCDTEDVDDGSKVYSHFTCATDTNNMRFVFEAVKSTILDQNIKEYF